MKRVNIEFTVMVRGGHLAQIVLGQVIYALETPDGEGPASNKPDSPPWGDTQFSGQAPQDASEIEARKKRPNAA